MGQQRWDSLLEETADHPYEMSDPISSANNNEENGRRYGYFSPVAPPPMLNRDVSASSPSLTVRVKPYTPVSPPVPISIDIPKTHLDKSPVLSPIFKSKAARQIINEMSGGGTSSTSNEQNATEQTNTQSKCSVRRLIPKEKRRHYTAPHNILSPTKSGSNTIAGYGSHRDRDTDDSFSAAAALGRRRARDDLDMERALRHRTDTPDVVRSTLSSKELKYNEDTIENLLGTPNKITIPERYIPEKLPQLSPEEQQHRLRKVESIKKMLSDTTILRSIPSSSQLAAGASTSNSEKPEQVPEGRTSGEGSSETNTAASKMVEEKRQREHLLQLNQILAKQVMEMSKIVAGENLLLQRFSLRNLNLFVWYFFFVFSFCYDL